MDGGAGGLRVEVRGAWTWVTAPASGLGCVVGGSGVDALTHAGPEGWVACGPMFDRAGPRYLLVDTVTRTANPSREPSRGVTVCVGEAGTVRAELGAGLDGLGCRVSVQGYPALVFRGRSSTVAPSDDERRVALAVVGDRVALVAGYGSMAALRDALRAGGARTAVYLDGGRAAHLRSAREIIYEHTDAERPASWILLR